MFKWLDRWGSHYFWHMTSYHWQISASHLRQHGGLIFFVAISPLCDTSILWLITVHCVTCFVTNTGTVFTYSVRVGSMDIWWHSGTLLELVLLARKSNGPKLLFWKIKFSYSIFSWMFAVLQVSILLDWLIGGRAMQWHHYLSFSCFEHMLFFCQWHVHCTDMCRYYMHMCSYNCFYELCI